MKLAFVITRSDEIGGAHIHVRDLAIWMSSLGHEVRIYVGGEGPFTEILSDNKLQYISLVRMVRSISPLNDYLAIGELRKHLIKFSPDVVSSHSAKAGLVARLACRSIGLPCIFTAHGWSFSDGVGFFGKFVYKNIERYLSKYSAKIITVCENDRRLALNSSVSSSDDIVTIHNGMPDRADVRSSTGDSSIIRLVMVARFEKQKDHLTLIKALSLLRHLKWTLDLVGDGPLLSSTQESCREYGIADRVNFLGRRKDVHEILCSSDVFVLSTNWEGFPRSILEAMRSSLPVVATSVAGVPESVVDGYNGYLIDAKNHIQFSEKLSSLIGNPMLRVTFGENGRAMYQEKFTFEIMASKTYDIYKDSMVKSV